MRTMAIARNLPAALLAAALAFAVLATSIGAADLEPVTLPGTGDATDVLRELVVHYAAQYPERKVVVPNSIGSDGGVRGVGTGESPVGRVARKPTPEEVAKYGDFKYVEFARVPVAFVVSAKAGVKGLTEAQICDIYSGKIDNWKGVGGPDSKIIPYSRENSSGTYVFFKEHVLQNADYTPRAQAMPGTAAVVNAVVKEKFGIGYGGAAYAKGIKVLKIKKDAASPAIAPEDATIKSGTYPLSRPLFFYVRANPSAEIKAFTDWVLSAEGQGIVTKVGYFPIK